MFWGCRNIKKKGRKKMKNPDILTQSNFQTRIIPISFNGYGKKLMLAGCPVNATGQFANDGSAIGILLDDVMREYAYGEIVTEGFVDYEVAQNHAGIEYSKECMTALKNIVFEGVGDKWVTGGGGGDILETVTVTEPNIVYETILVESGWNRLEQALWKYTPAPDVTLADGEYTVVFNGVSLQGIVEDGTFMSNDGNAIYIEFGDGGFIGTGLLDSAMDVPLQIINGTIEKTETKIKQEYMPTWEDLGMGFGTVFEAEGISLDYISEADSSSNMNFTSSIPLIAGKSYNVTINGETYSNVIAEIVMWDGRTNVILGDMGKFTSGAWTENGYPFVMVTPGREGAVILLQGEVASCDIKIEGETTIPIPSEYLPAMFVHFKHTGADGYMINHTYDEIVNVIEACGSVVATMSMYGSVVELSYKIETPDDVNGIVFMFNSREIILKSNNTIEYNGIE